MTAPSLVLRKHRLRHLPELRVHENMLEPVFAAGCSMMNCNATCCGGGVFADIKERETILEHVALITQYMEPDQEHDPAQWFDEHEVIDMDFPSGKAIGTKATEHGCVFLDSKGRCVLQTAASEEGMGKFALKPFYCVAYPVTINKATLMIDDPTLTERNECCSAVGNGSLTVFEVCAEELEFTLGPKGIDELRQLVDVPAA